MKTNGNAIITYGSNYRYHIWYILPDDTQVMLASNHPTREQAEEICRRMKLTFIVRERTKLTRKGLVK